MQMRCAVQDYYNTFMSRRPVTRNQSERRYPYREGRTALQQHERQVRQRYSCSPRASSIAHLHFLWFFRPHRASPTLRIRGTE